MGKGKKKITVLDEIPLQDPLLCSNNTIRACLPSAYLVRGTFDSVIDRYHSRIFCAVS